MCVMYLFIRERERETEREREGKKKEDGRKKCIYIFQKDVKIYSITKP